MSNTSEIWPELRQRIEEIAAIGGTDAIGLLLEEFPQIRGDSELLLDCIQTEWSVRTDPGPLDVDAYVRRFPECADALRHLFETHSGSNRPTITDVRGVAVEGSSEIPAGAGTTANFSQSTDLAETYVPAVGSSQGVSGKIGRYELLNEVARGGMGVVYRAFDQRLDRMVAIKLIKSGQLADQEQVQRFQQEAQAAAQLHHSAIVPVFEVGQDESQHYLVMEFVEGRSLWQEVSDSPLEPRLAASLMQQVGEAVQYAHDRGIVHRDLKPQNILLATDGRPRILDFGLAKRQQTDSSLTESGQILGTPSYMSPEQAQGKTSQIGRPSDVYSLGATFYCLLTGRPPFRAANQIETIQEVIAREPVPPRKHNKSISRDLETICLKCLQKQPEQRYASAREFAEDLGRFLRSESIKARRAGWVERTSRWVRRNRLVSLVICLLFVDGIALIVGYINKRNVKEINDVQSHGSQVQRPAEPASTPQPQSEHQQAQPASDPPAQPVRDLVLGNLRRELFDGRSLTGWRANSGSMGVATPPLVGPVMTLDGIVFCVFANREDEELQNYRLTFTVYTNQAEALVIRFGQLRGEDVPESFYSVVLSSKGSYLERSAADGREKNRISDLNSVEWNGDIPHTIIIEQQHGWWFVSVDNSAPITAPRGKRETLRKFDIQTYGQGPAWIKSVQLHELIAEPPKS